MRIYDLTKDVAAIFPVSDLEYKAFTQVMTSGGLPLLVHYLNETVGANPLNRGFNPPAVFSILDHVMRRTCAFYKPLEFIKIPEVIKGRLDVGIAPALAKDTTIKANLKLLEQAKFLIKIRFKHSATIHALYGLDLYRALLALHVCWERDLGEIHNFNVMDLKHLTPKSRFASWLYRQLTNAYEFQKEHKREKLYKRVRDLRNPFPDFDSFLARMEKICKK